MKITVAQVEYNSDNHSDLIELVKADYDLVGELQAKRLLLGEVTADDKILGIFIFRTEVLINGEKELVVCHVVSDKTTTPEFTSLTLPFVVQLAKQNKMKSVRVHTDEKAVERLAMQRGFKYFETVLVMDI